MTEVMLWLFIACVFVGLIECVIQWRNNDS